jgi:hypothetical protein
VSCSLWMKPTDALSSNFIIGNINSTCFGESFCPSSGACTSAVVRLRSSWWWAERLPETCRVNITNNKIGTQCVCWFYSQGIYHDARSYNPKMYVLFFFVVCITQNVFLLQIVTEITTGTFQQILYSRILSWLCTEWRRCLLHVQG